MKQARWHRARHMLHEQIITNLVFQISHDFTCDARITVNNMKLKQNRVSVRVQSSLPKDKLCVQPEKGSDLQEMEMMQTQPNQPVTACVYLVLMWFAQLSVCGWLRLSCLLQSSAQSTYISSYTTVPCRQRLLRPNLTHTWNAVTAQLTLLSCGHGDIGVQKDSKSIRLEARVGKSTDNRILIWAQSQEKKHLLSLLSNFLLVFGRCYWATVQEIWEMEVMHGSSLSPALRIEGTGRVLHSVL